MYRLHDIVKNKQLETEGGKVYTFFVDLTCEKFKRAPVEAVTRRK